MREFISCILCFFLLIGSKFTHAQLKKGVTHVTIKNAQLSNNTVYNLHEKEGRIFVSTDNGVTIIRNGKSKFLYNEKARSNSFSIFREDKKGSLYLMNFRNQIFKLENDSLKLYLDVKDYFDTRIYSYFFSEKYLYVNSINKLRRFSIDTHEVDVSFDEQQKKDEIPAWFYTESKTIGDSTFIGLILLYNDEISISREIREFLKIEPSYNTKLLSSVYTESNYLLFGKDKIYFSDREESTDYNFPINKATRFFYTGEFKHYYWGATNSGFIFLPKNNPEKNRLVFKGLSCSDAIEDKQGNIWVGTLGDGLKLITEPESKSYKLEHDNVFSSYLYNDEVYLGTEKGQLLSANNEVINLYQTVNNIYSDSNNIFIKTNDSSFIVENGKIKNRVQAAGYYNNTFVSDSITFFSSRYHVMKVNNYLDKFKSNQLQDNRKYHIPGCFAFKVFGPDKFNRYFGFNLSNGEVRTLDNQNLIFDHDQLLFKDLVYGYPKNEKKFYLLDNHDDLYHVDFDKERLNKIYSFTHIKPKKIALNNKCFVGYENGLLELYYREDHQTYLYDKYNKFCGEEIVDIWISDSSVFLVFKSHLHSLDIEKLKKESSFTSLPLSINGNNKPNTFYHQNEIISVALNFHDQLNCDNLKLRYRLNKGAWVYQNYLEVVRFQNLSYGLYDFEVEIYRYGNKLVEHKKISFHILPYWYQTTWFILIIILLTLIVFYKTYQYRLSLLKRRQQAKLDLITAKLSAVNAQMKPHFLFNTLNSIQNTILNEDKLTACERLSEFSSFIRKTLEISRKPEISLEEEIEIINDYVNFECYRFKNRFDFKVIQSIDKNLLKTKIPPFIIQPYVENAILHGVAHLEKKGKILLELANTKNKITCTISDNGIGIENSKKLNNKKKKYRSFAKEANYNRISLLNNGEIKTNSGTNGTIVKIEFEI